LSLNAVEKIAGVCQARRRCPALVGILLMLPIGIIIALLSYYFFTFRGGLFLGEFIVFYDVLPRVGCHSIAVLEIQKEILA